MTAVSRVIGLFIFTWFLGAVTVPGYGQSVPDKLSKDTKISVLTVSPAEPVFTIFGHTAIRVQDLRNHVDRVYNYGSFDFDTSYFYFKFLYGNLDYFLSVVPFHQFKEKNAALGRSIVSQTLDLTSSQVKMLIHQLEENSLPQNRSYQYRFFKRNCVTQVRDLLSEVTPKTLLGQVDGLSTTTYRRELGSYLANRPWVKLGINLMLGAKADQPLTNREKTFLPRALYQNLTSASSSSGGALVKSNKVITEANLDEHTSAAGPVYVFGDILILIMALTVVSILQGWHSWWIDRLLFGSVGLLGIVIAFGSFISMHPILQTNWNLLWALPTHLIAAIWMKKISRSKSLRIYFWITIVLNLLTLAGWTLIPQKLPVSVIPLVASLIIRSAFRLYEGALSNHSKRLNASKNNRNLSSNEGSPGSIPEASNCSQALRNIEATESDE